MPPTITQEQLQALRLKYNAAYTAYQSCATAIAEAAMAGERPSDALQDGERKAALALEDAREKLRAGMAALIAKPEAP